MIKLQCYKLFILLSWNDYVERFCYIDRKSECAYYTLAFNENATRNLILFLGFCLSLCFVV